ncbi:MAG: hypothetical protein FJY65_03840 [Calditrichaeota bacterium]|nr:hypothetical protein [Calditrichota bacterium]
MIKIYRQPGPLFWARISLSPYGLGIDVLGRRRTVADNDSPRRYSRSLVGRSRAYPDVIVIGAEYEPYPTAEKRLRLTRRCLELSAKYNYPVFVITRTALILRDIDILREIHETSFVSVAVPLASLTARTANEIGDRSTARLRLQVLDRVCRSGVQTGVLLEPLNPTSTRQWKEIERLYKIASEANYDFIAPSVGLEGGNWMKRGAQFGYGITPPLIPPRNSGGESELQPTRNSGGESRRQLIPCCRLDKSKESNVILESDTNAGRKLLALARQYRMPLQPRRWQPPDFRRENFWLAGQLAAIALKRRLNGQTYRSYLSVAKKINNLQCDVRNLVRNNALHSLTWVNEAIWPDIERLMGGQWAPREEWEV